MSEYQDQQLESLLSKLPQYQTRTNLDTKVFAGIHRLAVLRNEQAAAQQAPKRESGFSIFRKYVFATGTTFLVLLGGTTAWSYQDTVTYGDPLYGLKRSAEKIELSFANKPIDQVQTHIRFANRRMAELENLLDGTNKPGVTAFWIQTAYAYTSNTHVTAGAQANISRTVTDMQSSIGQATNIIETNDLPVTEAEQALITIEHATDDHVTRLGRFTETAPIEVAPLLTNFSDEQEHQLSAIVEAIDETKEARRQEISRVKVNLTSPRLARAQQLAEAETTITEVRDFVGTLNLDLIPQEERVAISNDIDSAESALKNGKVGIGLGLSRVAKKRILNKPELMKAIGVKADAIRFQALPKQVATPPTYYYRAPTTQQQQQQQPQQNTYTQPNSAPAPRIIAPTVQQQTTTVAPTVPSIIVPNFRFIIPETKNLLVK